jgi:hypothetical protein
MDGALPGFHVPKNKKSPDAPNGTPGGFVLPKRQSLKSRAEPSTGNAALYKGRSLSNYKSYGV